MIKLGIRRLLDKLGKGRKKGEKKGEKKAKVALCPACERSLVYKVPSSISGWLVPDQYYCEKCGYIGYIYLEVDAKELEQYVIQQQKEEDRKKNV